MKVKDLISLNVNQLQQLHTAMAYDSALYADVTRDEIERPLPIPDFHKPIYTMHHQPGLQRSFEVTKRS